MKIYSPGTHIGRCEIASRPMMGGMGIVYLCLDHQENRPVALETFRPEYLPARDRFLRGNVEIPTWPTGLTGANRWRRAAVRRSRSAPPPSGLAN